ncbi:Putative zinc-finger [Proteiniborus ethanoligenes]|uniref:Putative zinc-finger n=1 Tax=Proteiniborus ethanoligenes TaxID=415015 RepID=A0A1H3S4E3_9FIRM|nr:DUF4349 domain-containing protein [Proteiniborus ethanoligenes]SDZ32331.1 Putative zinc-finger [Proteiniborus ethanoligenes]
MNCNDFIGNVSLYIDDELSKIENKEFELHILKCNNCRREYEEMINIIKNVREQEQVELPDNYKFELRRKLKEAAKEDKKPSWKVITSIAASLIVMIISFGMLRENLKLPNINNEISNDSMAPQATKSKLSEENIALSIEPSTENKVVDGEHIITENLDEESGDKEMAIFRNSSIVEEAEFDNSMNDYGAMASRSGIVNGRKSIKEAYLCIETEELDLASKDIADHVEENGGYVEAFKTETNKAHTSTNSKNYLIKIRIPADKFEETLDFLRTLGNILDEESMLSDVTDQYYRIETKLRNLNEQEVLLREILDRAESITDILLVEDEIEKLKQEISTELGAIEKIENAITLPTINAKLNGNK